MKVFNTHRKDLPHYRSALRFEAFFFLIAITPDNNSLQNFRTQGFVLFYHSVILLDDVLKMLQGLSKCLGMEGAVCSSLQNPLLQYLQPPTTFHRRRDARFVYQSTRERRDHIIVPQDSLPSPLFLFSRKHLPWLCQEPIFSGKHAIP